MVLKNGVRPDHSFMSIEIYASRRLATEILQPYNYKSGVLPVLDTQSIDLEEFIIRIGADDPAFEWRTKDSGERYPVGFMYWKLRSGDYVLLANEDESAVELAERVKKLADDYIARDEANRLAVSA